MLKEFKSADLQEMMHTPFTHQIHINNSLFWTPIFQKKEANSNLLDYFLDSSFYPDTDIFNKKGDIQKINQMVEALIDSAFDDDELFMEDQPQTQENSKTNFIKIQKNVYLPSTKESYLHGTIDYLIYNELTKTFLAILVHEKVNTYTPHNGYFDISPSAAITLHWYFVKNYKMEEGFKILTTNGHKWQLHSTNSSGTYERTKQICSKDQVIYKDKDTIEIILGLIRFASGIKCEDQNLIENIYKLYNDQTTLKQIDKN